MAVLVVNTVPGDVTEPIRPRQPVQFSVKSTTGKVALASIEARMGMTNIANKSPFLPTDGPHFASVVLDRPERIRPAEEEMPVETIAQGLVIDSTGAQIKRGIFEMTYEVDPLSPILGHISLPVFPTQWAVSSGNFWCDQTNLVNFYFGVEYGPRNTGLFAFLRAGGGLVVGGPLQDYGTARPGQVELNIGWNTLTDGTVLDLFVIIDPNQLTAEVRVLTPELEAPYLAGTIPLLSLGQFPPIGLSQSNGRHGPSDVARLYFGNPGAVGEILSISDFALYPKFGRSMQDGLEGPGYTTITLPDSPVVYEAKTGKHPDEIVPGRWVPFGTKPIPEFYFQPGILNRPLFTRFSKKDIQPSGFMKKEPRLGMRQDGAMIEAYLSGTSNVDGTGLGFGFEDGQKRYLVSMVRSLNDKTFAIVKDLAALDSKANGYWSPDKNFDFSALRLVRLIVDRAGNKVKLFVDDMDKPIVTKSLSDTFPDASDTNARVVFGHLFAGTSASEFAVAFLRYLPRFLSWESDSGLPQSMGPVGVGTTSMSGTPERLWMVKPSFGAAQTEGLHYWREHLDLDASSGIQVDFRTRVVRYTNAFGAEYALSQWTGAGVTVSLGPTRLVVGFFDCGSHGRKIGILANGATVNDIVNQTPLGRTVSASVNWAEHHTYRVVMRSLGRLELWIDSIIDSPAISLGWEEHFNLLPGDLLPGVYFGHFEPKYASTTEWEYVRWGLSNGYEVSMAEQHPKGLEPHLFDGRILYLVDFSQV